jgi:hypothetical protein
LPKNASGPDVLSRVKAITKPEMIKKKCTPMPPYAKNRLKKRL